MFVRFRVVILLAFLALGLSPVLASAQATTTVRVVTTDQSGAVVPAVTLTLVHRETLVERQAVSAADGTAEFLALTPGRYTLTAELAGFTPARIDDIVAQGTDVVLSVKLAVNAVSDAVTVIARLPGTGSYRADRGAIATKTDTPLIETPVSASIVTRQFMDDTQITTITEALRFVPGVYSGDNGRAAVDENISLRGFSYLRSTFVDGTRQQAYNIDINPEPYGLERIEVLRGAASVLYGSTQPGGIVNSVSRRPRRARSTELMVSGGSLGLFRLGVDATGPVANSPTLSYRVTGFLRDQGDLADNGFNDRLYLAPAVTWAPSTNTEVTALGSYQRDRFRFVPYLPANGTLRPSAFGTIPRSRNFSEPSDEDDRASTYGAKLLVTHRFSDRVKLQHATGYRNYDRFTNYLYIDLPADSRTAERFIYPVTTKATVWSTDTNVQATGNAFGAAHTVTIGADYYRIHDRSSTEEATLAPLDAFAPSYGASPVLSGRLSANGLTTLNQVGAYVQDQARVADRVVLLGGVRVDTFTLDSNDPVSGYQDAIDSSALTGRAGVVFLAGNGFAPYASYTQGFYPQGGLDANGRGFDPDESDQWEGGVKYEAPDKRSSLAVALFTINRRNLLTPDPQNPQFSIQTGEQRHRGLEAEFNLGLTSSWGLLGSYTFLDAEITRSEQFINGVSVVGKQPTNIPRHAASIWSVYSFARDSRLAGLSVSLGGRLQSSREGDALNTFRTPRYALLDGALAYNFGPWRVSLTGTNLADSTYYAATVGFSDYVRFGDPRLVMASLTRGW